MQCSKQSNPPSMAACMATVGWTWAVTCLPMRWASSAAVRNSSTLYWARHWVAPRRGGAARAEYLDAVRSALNDKADGLPDLVGVIHFGGVGVVMPAGRGDGMGTRYHSWPRDHATGDCVPHRHSDEVLPAQIAYSGQPGSDCELRVLHALDHHLVVRGVKRLPRRQESAVMAEVDVCVL